MRRVALILCLLFAGTASASCTEYVLVTWAARGLPSGAHSFRVFSSYHGWTPTHYFNDYPTKYALFWADALPGDTTGHRVVVWVYDQYGRIMGTTAGIQVRDCGGTYLIPIRIYPIPKEP